MKLDFLAGGLIGCMPAIADHDLVAFGQDIFDGDTEIRPFLVRTFHHRLGRLRADRDAVRFVVIQKILTEVFQRDFGFFSIYEIFKMISHEGFHFF